MAYVFEEYPENFAFQLFFILELFCNLLLSFKVSSSIALYISYFFRNKALRPNSL